MDVLDDFWWADRFGWTPTQVDAMGLDRAARLHYLTDAIDEGRRQGQEDQARQSERG